jgi:hypothetical protein
MGRDRLRAADRDRPAQNNDLIAGAKPFARVAGTEVV